MGYQRYKRPQPKERRWRIHPIWRGIGCLLLILIPIVAFAAGDLLVENYQDVVDIPPELAKTLQVGESLTIEFFFAKLLVAVVLAVVLFLLLSLLYAVFYWVMGGDRLDPRDAPPRHRPFGRSQR